jgi:diguanylate cyclase (GGDEF)-like protein/PAS domain S-box-containing protein
MEKNLSKTVLLIAVQPEKAQQIRELLTNSSSSVFELTHVESLSDAEKFLALHSTDIILLDFGMVNPSGLEAVSRVQAAAPHSSIVLLSSAQDEQIAIQAIREGAQDYLIKNQIELRALVRALLNAVERKKIEEAQFSEKERAQATLDSIGDAVICTDTSGNITFMNRVAETMTGRPLNEVAGLPMAEAVQMIDAVTRKTILDPMAKAAEQNSPGSLPLNSVLINPDGQEVPIEDSVAPIQDREGQVTGAVIVFRDVSATRALEKELTDSAQHDSLTGLPNRMLLHDRVTQAISLARRQRCHAAVLFLDLDGFKEINDSLGHLIGDKVLQSVAKRLLSCVRSPDTVIRQGGDEFIVVLQELRRPQNAVFTVERLLKTVAVDHSIDQHEIHITTSVGVSVYPHDGQDAETLIRNADIAMYHAKKDGLEKYRLFSPEMALEEPRPRSSARDIWRSLDWYELLAGSAVSSDR